MSNQLPFLRAKVQAIKTVLDKASAKERESRVATHLAQQFNDVLKEIGAAYPDAAPHLPKPIPSSVSLLRRNGLSDVSYMDLMVFAEQVLNVLSVVESQG